MAAARIIAGTQTVGFTPADDAGRLVLELDNRQGLAPGTTLRVRLYPAVPALLAASRGGASLTLEQRVRTVQRELLAFGGSDRAAPDYPISALSDVQITSALFTLDPVAGYVPAGLRASDFHLDPASGEIVAPVRLWGAIVIGYTAVYRIVLYSPETIYVGFGGPVTTAFGTLYAFYQGASAELAIDMGRNPAGRNRAGLYVAYSTYVADEGLSGWETPPNWPDSADYPTAFPEGTPDPDASATRERPHRVGSYNRIGQIFEDEFWVRILRPYSDSAIYHPKVWVRFAGPPPAGSDYEDGYQRAIQYKDEILDDLDDAYPEFQGEGGP